MKQYDYVRAIKQGVLQVKPPILSPTRVVVGQLWPITYATLESPDVIEAITRWRAMHQHSYASRFTPTPARTREWLHDVVLPDDRRMLALIAWSKRPIGLTGFRDLTDVGYEGDNLVRGERGGGSNFMLLATTAFHSWAMTTFGLQQTWLRVLASNQAALDLHLSAGCTEERRVPLYRCTDGGHTTLVEQPHDPPAPPVDQMVYLTRTIAGLKATAPQCFH